MNASEVRSRLQAMGLDALVTFAPENITFMTGSYNAIRDLIKERPSIVVWPLASDPFVVAPEVELAWLEEHSSVEDVVAYRGVANDAVSALRERVEDTDLQRAVVGVDMDLASAALIRGIESSLSGWELVDAGDLIGELRAVKTEEQVDLLRKAGLATDRAEWSALRQFEIGWTGHQLGLVLRKQLLEEGADSILFLNLGSGPDNRAAHPKPSMRAPKPGEILRFDLGGVFDGWCTDMAKTAAIGQATTAQTDMFKRLRAILDRHIARMTPGAESAGLYRKVEDDFDANGMAYRGPHVGHGIGLSVHEKPILAPSSEMTLQPGMVLCAEVVHRATDTEFFHLEELVLVDSDRSLPLSRSEPTDDELPIIG
jgi:Xaa-Pro aminopeptidase